MNSELNLYSPEPWTILSLFFFSVSHFWIHSRRKNSGLNELKSNPHPKTGNGFMARETMPEARIAKCEIKICVFYILSLQYFCRWINGKSKILVIFFTIPRRKRKKESRTNTNKNKVDRKKAFFGSSAFVCILAFFSTFFFTSRTMLMRFVFSLLFWLFFVYCKDLFVNG